MRVSGVLRFIFLVFPMLVHGQITLEGRVTGTGGQAIANIHILVYAPGSQSIAGFSVSDRNGAWRMEVNLPTDSLDIATSSVQYRAERRRIANRSQVAHFALLPEVRQLQEFTVRAPGIVQRGDTISYLVSAFVHGQDRTIADVLNRMPGIEVQASGRILYQGRPIQHFFVEGLDLMGGRYAMVSQNLPHRSVATVEILENHQPIRVLEKRVPSFEASLNLRLKREITTTGTARLASAPSPFLWYANITPMTFVDGFQVLTSYQGNNTGRDLAGQLHHLTIEDLGRQVDRPVATPNLLGIQPISPGNMPGRRFRVNNSHLLNTNGLVRLNNDIQLRANLHYLNDSQSQEGLRHSAFHTPTGTIAIAEQQTNRMHFGHLQGEFTLKRNVQQQFLENKLQFNAVQSNKRGWLETGHLAYDQALHRPLRNISNDLRVIQPFGTYLVEFLSYISYDNRPHHLIFGPGRFDQALGIQQSAEYLRQDLDQSRLFADHSAGFTFPLLGLSIGPRLGISYHRHNLISQLHSLQTPGWLPAGTDFANTMESRHIQTYLHTEVNYRRNNLSLTARLPVIMHDIRIADANRIDGQQKRRLVFNPSVRANFRINPAVDVGGSVSHNTRFGAIDDVFFGFILMDYRRLQRNAVPLSQTRSSSFSVNSRYRNPFASIFTMANYIFTISDRSLILSHLIQPDGTTLLQALEMPNRAFMHSINSNISFPIRPLSTNFNFNASMGLNQRKVLVNNELFESINRFINLDPKVNISFMKGVSMEYGINLTVTDIGGYAMQARTVSLLRHHTNIAIIPGQGHTIVLSAEEFRIRGSVTRFVDLEYRFTIPNRKIDLSLNFINLLNNKTYSTIAASEFSTIETSYPLRGRNITLSARLSF